jgi:hypothetical protein
MLNTANPRSLVIGHPARGGGTKLQGAISQPANMRALFLHSSIKYIYIYDQDIYEGKKKKEKTTAVRENGKKAFILISEHPAPHLLASRKI